MISKICEIQYLLSPAKAQQSTNGLPKAKPVLSSKHEKDHQKTR